MEQPSPGRHEGQVAADSFATGASKGHRRTKVSIDRPTPSPSPSGTERKQGLTQLPLPGRQARGPKSLVPKGFGGFRMFSFFTKSHF